MLTNFYIVNNVCLKLLVLKSWFVDILLKIICYCHYKFAKSSISLSCTFGFFKHNSKFPCEKSLLLDKTLTHYLHRIMSMWVQSDKYKSAWLHRIRTKSIQDPERPPFLKLNHLPNLEAYTCPTKKYCSSKTFTQLDSLPS